MAEKTSESDDNMQVTVSQLIAVLQKLPPEAPIAYVDFTGYDDIDAYVNEHGAVEIGPK